MQYRFLIVILLAAFAGCSSVPPTPGGRLVAATFQNEQAASPAAREVGMYSLMLLKTGYQFGGKNPAAGLDCSGTDEWIGMDSHIRMCDPMDTGMVLRRCVDGTSTRSLQGLLPA